MLAEERKVDGEGTSVLRPNGLRGYECSRRRGMLEAHWLPEPVER